MTFHIRPAADDPGTRQRRHDYLTSAYGPEWTDDPDFDHLAATKEYEATKNATHRGVNWRQLGGGVNWALVPLDKPDADA